MSEGKDNPGIMYQSCHLCPRECRVDRTAGERGVCGTDDRIRVARAALHFWEEPCISGEKGSGTVFFAGCALRCIYCQNREIRTGEAGREISIQQLAQTFLDLQEQGANNINLVTPDHFAPSVAEALSLVKTPKSLQEGRLHIPVICNCSGYMSEDMVRLLAPYVDVWLPDMKYISAELSGRFSFAPDYFTVADRALHLMTAQVPEADFDADGMIRRGVIVRHLVLPGHTRESMDVIRYLHREYKDRIYISILKQYTPMPGIEKEGYPELARTLTEREYARVVNFALEEGVSCGFIQEGDAAKESFIPSFMKNR